MFALKITDGTNKIAHSIQSKDARLLPALQVALDRGLLGAMAIAQREYLHGPRPARLGVVSTKLSSNIARETQIINSAGGGTLYGYLGDNVKYAARHEFGFKGVENVKGFVRAEGGRKAAGRRRKGFTNVGFVRPFTRNVNYPGKPFIRPALEKALPQMNAEFNKALADLASSQEGAD